MAAAEGQAAAAERSSILIVDDLPEQLLVLETILSDLGQNLVFVRSGSEALREVLKREFAVILLDVNMPDIDGFETATLIRKYRRSAHTPIIFVTAYADEIQTARGYSLGAVDYILAPVVPEVLRSKIKVFVELNMMQRQLRQQADERIAVAAAEAAQRAAEESNARSKYLAQASRVLSASLEVQVIERKLLELLVPELGASATLVLLSAEHHADRALCCESRGRDAPKLIEYGFDELPPATRGAFERVLLSFPEPIDDSRDLAARASMVPLRVGDRLLGAMQVQSSGGRGDQAMLDDLANRAAVAFENARLYRDLQIEIAQRQQAQASLQDTNQRKDEFLAMLSHELRNPLAPIRNAVDVIRRIAPPEPKLVWATDVTERQVSHLTRLIDELLDVARIGEGKIALQAEAIDLLAVIAHSIETARPLIESRRHALMQRLPEGPIWVRGDSARLSQVVSNLLNNAAKYTEEGGAIQLAVSVEQGQAIIIVRDNGIGIEEELLPKVFDLFRQGKQALDRSQGGLGVGLTLAQRLVHLHNGRIEVSSAGTGKGAEFRVVLPCLTEVKAANAEPALAASATVMCRILVVDDNVDAAQMIAACLEMAGHEVKAVTDGAQALACAPIYAPEVVVLDIGLPLLDGYQVARQLRVLEQTQSALLIALTGYGREADKELSRQAGFDCHLVKPADPDELAKLIADWRTAAPKRLSSSRSSTTGRWSPLAVKLPR